jgi:hypothetical protein
VKKRKEVRGMKKLSEAAFGASQNASPEGVNGERGPKWFQDKGLEGRQSEVTRSVRWDCNEIAAV